MLSPARIEHGASVAERLWAGAGRGVASSEHGQRLPGLLLPTCADIPL